MLIAQGSFANFLTAKENERYELLEKLIGCEETYTNIATEIKKAKDQATYAYNQYFIWKLSSEDCRGRD